MTARADIILAAGGTGGHVMPAAAIAAELIDAGLRPRWFTDPRGERYTSAFPSVKAEIMPGLKHMSGGAVSKLLAWLGLLLSLARCLTAFVVNRPALVVGFGGYPSFPPVLAAQLLFIPTVLHEQNAVLGRVNRFLAARAKLVLCGMRQTSRLPVKTPSQFVGNPVRPELKKSALQSAYQLPGETGSVSLLLIGGSQGATGLSQLVPHVLAGLPQPVRSRLRVTHQARPADAKDVEAVYAEADIEAHIAPFFDDMAALLTSSHMVIARAGASTLAELSLFGRPTVLVPLQIAADRHQHANAELYREMGAAWVIEEGDDSAADSLRDTLTMALEGDGAALKASNEAMLSLAMPGAAEASVAALKPLLAPMEAAA